MANPPLFDDSRLAKQAATNAEIAAMARRAQIVRRQVGAVLLVVLVAAILLVSIFR